MAYTQRKLDRYREALLGKSVTEEKILGQRPIRFPSCPYCNGERDPTPKYVNPSTKPATPLEFWNHVILNKYRHVQSVAARANMSIHLGAHSSCEEVNATTAAHSAIAETHSDAAACATNITPMFVLGPMVDQSELPFRMLCRQKGCTLAYTPMMHAKCFAESATYRQKFFSTTPLDVLQQRLKEYAEDTCDGVAEEGDLVDRPCIVQFCGNDADTVLQAARLAVRGEYLDPRSPTAVRTSPADSAHGCCDTLQEFYFFCDAVDLNLGCPQGIARRGNYGAFLMEDWERIHTIIHTLHVELEVPVTAKIRVFDRPAPHSAQDGSGQWFTGGTSPEHHYDEALTIAYAQMLCDAGAQLLCVHGRTRAMKGQQTGLANIPLIARIRYALQGRVPVIANGNVLVYDDVVGHLRVTGCEGHMCAEPLLWDPALFSNPEHPVRSGRLFGATKPARIAAIDTALNYLRWLHRCPVDLAFAKAHLLKMCYHSYELHTDMRDYMAGFKATEASSFRKDTEKESTEESKCAVAKIMEIPSDGQSCIFPVEGLKSDRAVYERCLDELATHLRHLRDIEVASTVLGEQPKAAQEAKAAAKALQIDVFEGEGGDLNFFF